jgi:acyl-CoA thioesterase FadM
MWIESVGRSSYVMRAEIVDDDGTVAARARSVLVGFDKDTEKSAPLPEEFRTYLLGLLEVAE